MARKPKRRPGLPQIVEKLLRDDSTAIEIADVQSHLERSYGVNQKNFDAILKNSLRSGTLIRVPSDTGSLLTTKKMQAVEEKIFTFLEKRKALAKKPLMTEAKFDKAIQDLEKELKLQFDSEQLSILRGVFVDGERTVVLCGFAGSGKTTVMYALQWLAKKSGMKDSELLGGALAGKAVQRLQTVSGIESQTLHSSFRIVPGRVTRNRALKFVKKTKMMVVDESSMLCSSLFSKTLAKLPNSMIVLIVGDPSQLPPIGSGQPFADLVGTEYLPKYELKTNHRSGNGSALSEAVGRVRNNQLPEVSEDIDAALRFVPVSNEEQIRDLVVERCISLKQSDEDIHNFQVMSLTNVSEIGTRRLNLELQNVLNPDKGQSSIRLEKRIEGSRKTEPVTLRVGDKVIHETNLILKAVDFKDAEKSSLDKAKQKRVKMANGLVGTLVATDGKTVHVAFPEIQKIVRYAPAVARDSLALAWCLTVHKCQGSEYKRIMMPLLPTPSQRKLASNAALYTGLTRAKTNAEVFGSKSFFDELCSIDGSRITKFFGPRERTTYLKELLSDPSAFEKTLRLPEVDEVEDIVRESSKESSSKTSRPQEEKRPTAKTRASAEKPKTERNTSEFAPMKIGMSKRKTRIR